MEKTKKSTREALGAVMEGTLGVIGITTGTAIPYIIAYYALGHSYTYNDFGKSLETARDFLLVSSSAAMGIAGLISGMNLGGYLENKINNDKK